MLSKYHQCLQIGKKVIVNASNSPFQKDEAILSKVALFDELAEDKEVTPALPRGIPLPEWEALDRPV